MLKQGLKSNPRLRPSRRRSPVRVTIEGFDSPGKGFRNDVRAEIT